MSLNTVFESFLGLFSSPPHNRRSGHSQANYEPLEAKQSPSGPKAAKPKHRTKRRKPKDTAGHELASVVAVTQAESFLVLRPAGKALKASELKNSLNFVLFKSLNI